MDPLFEERSCRGKQEKRLIVGCAGTPLGERRYMEVRGAISAYLRAVFWFAYVALGGGGYGICVVVEGRGEVIIVPNGAKDSEVRGLVEIVIFRVVKDDAVPAIMGMYAACVGGRNQVLRMFDA